MPDNDTVQTAYHEAAHAVVAWDLGLTVLEATIVPDPAEDYAGRILFPLEDRVRYADWVDEHAYLEAFAIMYLAGPAAGDAFPGEPEPDIDVDLGLPEADSDHGRLANFILELAGPDEERQIEISERLEGIAKGYVGTRLPQIKTVAEALLTHGTLDEHECRKLLSEVLS